MEKNVTKEGICETNICNGPTSVDSGSAIDKKETDKCRHFSIRAYVAEIRSKDWKNCWPFASLGDNEEPKKQAEMLPPLQVPKFRWWACQNCLQRSDDSADVADIRLVFNSSADKICESRNSDVNTSVGVITSQLRPLIHDHTKEKVANVMSIIRQDVFTSGNYKNTVVRDVDRIIKEPNFCEMKDAQCVNGEVTKDAETIDLDLEGSGLVELGEANCGTSVVNEVMIKCANNSSTGVLKEAKTSEQVERMPCHKKPELGTLEKIVGCHTCEPHSLESSWNNDDKDAHNVHDQLHADQNGDLSPTLGSRKPQKFRLLTDIIRREVCGTSAQISSSVGITNSDHVNAKVTQTNAADEPDGLGLDIHSGGRVAVHVNVEKDNGGKNKKRKTLQAEDQEPLQMRWSKSVSENVHIYKRDQVNNCFDSAIANSRSVNDMFVWEGLHSEFKSQYCENRTDGKVIQGKKKCKMTRFQEEEHYLKPWQDGLCRELQLLSRKVESKGTGAGTLQLSNGGSTGRGLHPSFSLNLDAQETNEKSTSFMKESNILLDARATLIPLQEGMQRQYHVIRHGEENSQVEAGISSLRSAMDPFTGIGIHPDVFSNRATRRKAVVSEKSTKTDIVPAKTAQKRTGGLHTSVYCCMTSERSGKTSIITHHEGMPIEDRVISKEIGVKRSESTDISLRGRGAHSGLTNKKATLRKASTGIKQNDKSQILDGASPIWSKDLSFIHNYDNNMDVLGHSGATENQHNERTDEMGGLESLNDIPIEIVELLAKNRHEKRRLEAENANWNKFYMSETTKNVKDAENFEFSGVHEDGMSRYLWEKNLEMHKPLSSNVQGGISAAGRSAAVKPVGESIAYSSHLKQTCKSISSNRKHKEESRDSKGCFAFSVSSVSHSSRNPFAEAGTCENLGVQSCRWDGDMLGHGRPISSLQCLPSPPKRRIVSSPTRIRGAHHLSLSHVADDPFRIESSHKLANLSQRQNRNCHSKIFKEIIAEQPCACRQKKIGKSPNPVDPLGFYTNETMPATQLLKLMDAGMNSRVSHTVDENTEFTNQPCFPHTDHCKDLVPLHGGALEDASGRSQSSCFSKDYRAGNSGEHFPSVAISNAVAFPVQRDKICARSSRIMGQVSQRMVSDRVKSRRRPKRKSSYSPMQNADCKLHGSGSGRGGLGKSLDSFPINGLRAGFHSPSNSMIVPLKSHLMEGSIGNIEVEKKVETVWLLKGSCGTDICSVNRNPADFSIPEAGNEFMRGGGDLKCRKIISKRGRPRQRMMKLVALKEAAQNSIT